MDRRTFKTKLEQVLDLTVKAALLQDPCFLERGRHDDVPKGDRRTQLVADTAKCSRESVRKWLLKFYGGSWDRCVNELVPVLYEQDGSL